MTLSNRSHLDPPSSLQQSGTIARGAKQWWRMQWELRFTRWIHDSVQIGDLLERARRAILRPQESGIWQINGHEYPGGVDIVEP